LLIAAVLALKNRSFNLRHLYPSLILSKFSLEFREIILKIFKILAAPRAVCGIKNHEIEDLWLNLNMF